MVSYNEKHNEANGERGKDGPEENDSWNCGAEGPTRKRKVLELRKKQMKNAVLMLFFSQGTPCFWLVMNLAIPSPAITILIVRTMRSHG